MKNKFKFLSVILLGFAATACVEDIETPDRGPQGNPETEVQGTYTGTWTLEYTENTTVTTYTCDGTMKLAPKGEQAYAGIMTVDATFDNNAAMSISLSSAANISPLTNAGSYQIYNSVTPNGLTKNAKNLDGTEIMVDKTNPETGETKQVNLEINATFMGQIFPVNASGELVKSDPAALESVLDFTYTYQKTVMVNNRPRKLDCKEVYHFEGVCRK